MEVLANGSLDFPYYCLGNEPRLFGKWKTEHRLLCFVVPMKQCSCLSGRRAKEHRELLGMKNTNDIGLAKKFVRFFCNFGQPNDR